MLNMALIKQANTEEACMPVPATIAEAIAKNYEPMTQIFMDFDRVCRATNQAEYELILRMSDVLFLMRQIERDHEQEADNV